MERGCLVNVCPCRYRIITAFFYIFYVAAQRAIRRMDPRTPALRRYIEEQKKAVMYPTRVYNNLKPSHTLETPL